ncbi:hypothetical protein PENVUL_c014G01612 [Penicillium vulpinum]|uniref:Uncharacterized protein n=1 Tax=Penicillium vulpinum TaxID=29845 RepID=A0A1V6S0I5_9EURO|nr:hypothetical protein PENVUL_c014G01612 [Penicillium vulpinum]
MPMKLPKSFTRRKSSGNVIEDVEAPHQPSFRVFERPGPHRSMTDGAALTKPLSEGNRVPTMVEDSDNIFAERERPLDKSRGNYESSTSTRLSSSSTLPSSTEVPPPDDTQSPHSRIHDVPAPPHLSSALRAAGRTFSFGGRFSKSGPVVPRQQTPDTSRNRPVTGNTDSTATPPKLPDTDFALSSHDDFNKMFDNLGANSATRGPSPKPAKYSSSPPTHVLPQFQNSRAAAPAAINTDRSTAVESPPYSWDRRPSEEGLLRGPRSPPLNQSQSTLDTIVDLRKLSASPNQVTDATTSHRSLERPRGTERAGLRRSGVYSPKGESTPFDDEDAKMVRQSVMWTKENTSPWGEGSPSGGTPLIDKGKAPDHSGQRNPEADNMFQYRRSPPPADRLDPSIADHARLAVQYADSLPKSTSPGNKVMTPSQFEHYRKQQELRRSNSNATKSDQDSDHEFEDEEDEVEKQRETERQRRKQEAHLSVYRQQMMKITGQQAPVQSLRPVMGGPSSSTPNLYASRLSVLGEKSTSGKSSEEEDDDVPLGILAAHGFPTQNRPPTRLNNVSSNPNLRASMQPPYISSSSSVTGADPNGSRGNLPPFARNLPRDPYFGAGLVNNSNRESLAFGGGSVYGGSSSPGPPPGGLVGVIANEERARAMRRGSPNTQAMHDMGGVPRPYSMMPQQNVTPGEQASIQLSQQMNNMMQMQMQWMQQMMQMQGVQGQPMMQGMPMPPMMMPGGAMAMPPMGPPSISGPQSMVGNPNFRPMSMPTSALNMPPPLSPHIDQRTMSMLDPNISTRRTGSPMPNLTGTPFRPNTGYAASIAPSERSTVGMAPRYRPVSVMQPESNYAVASSTNKAFGNENHNPSMSQSQIPKSHLATVTVRPVSRSGTGVANGKSGSDDEENDDEAWADMVKKREKKKSNWKLKRTTSSFGDLLSAVH